MSLSAPNVPTTSKAANPDASLEPRYFSKTVGKNRRFYLPLKPGKSSGLSVISGGWERCGKEYRIKRSGFAYRIIEFVAAGAGEVILEGKRHDLKPGTILVYGPGMAHQIATTSEQPMSKYFIVFTARPGLELLKEFRLGSCTVAEVLHPEQIQQIFEELIDFGLSDRANRAHLCAVTLQYLVMKLGIHAVAPGAVKSSSLATYQRCRRYIEEHYPTVTSLQEVGEACHVDLAYLCRLFQRFGRTSPAQYLRHLRMNLAMDLLQNTERLVKEVAAELGFSDPYHFSRAFKGVFGVSPAMLPKRSLRDEGHPR